VVIPIKIKKSDGTGQPSVEIKTSTTCRIQVGPFDYVVKAGQSARQKGFPRVIRYAKNLQIACRFPVAPFD
jgi:hypothetical protein